MSTTAIYEIAPDLFRLSIYVPDFDMQFNHFLVRDEEPLLFHAGLKGMFPSLREAVAKIIDPAKLRSTAQTRSKEGRCSLLTSVTMPIPPQPCLANWRAQRAATTASSFRRRPSG